MENAGANSRLLVVDDDDAIHRFVASTLADGAHTIIHASSAEDALAKLDRDSYELILTDIKMPGMSGLELLAEIRRSDAICPIIIMTAFGSIETAVEAMRKGATDYVSKPLDRDNLRHRVNQAPRLKRLEAENRWLHDEIAREYRPGRIVAVSRRMRALVEMVEKLANSNATVLISGDSGTGKELLAHALHYGGPRSVGPFVAVNCAALPAGLVESELFGHAKGSFTGALKDRPGKMEAANRGTLFLDEVGELPLEVQPKLLRALQERTIERVGEHRPRRIDVRFVAATNRDLPALVKEGRFREDLYFRLAVVPLPVPPLRERREDIPALVRYLMFKIAGDDAPDITPEALDALSQRSWRGNVRELANVLERVLALHDEGPIEAKEFPPEGEPLSEPLEREAAAAPPADSEYAVTLPQDGAPLDEMVRDLVVQALERKGWNQSAAARMLRIPRHVLQYRMTKYTIVPPSRR